jgi:hypothetical protein
MNIETFLKLLPLLPEIKQMLATIERLEADADLKAAIATAEKVAAILTEKAT